jgi:hypothetical protein
MKTILGFAALAFLAVMLLVNALFMALSPKRWFRLPRWIAIWGSFRERTHSSGWGGIEVRLTGGMILAGFAYIIWNVFIGPAQVLGTHSVGVYLFIGAIIFSFVNALVMIASPSAWFRLPRWMGEKGGMTEAEYGQGSRAVVVRVIGVILLLGIGWAVYAVLSTR